MKAYLLILLATVCGNAFAEAPARHAPTPEQIEHMTKTNFELSIFDIFVEPPITDRAARPFADFEDVGYVLLSDGFNFNSRQAKMAVAANLPMGTDLVVITQRSDVGAAEQIRNEYANVISRNRVHVVRVADSGNIFWSRDAFPVPLTMSGTPLTLIDAQYYHHFSDDKAIANAFRSKLVAHSYYFEGGNFQVNDSGVCMIVNNNSHSALPDSLFKNVYGCSKLIRLPWVAGIGHVDERARFVKANTVVTDTESYVPLLQKEGFTVVVLPRPANRYETYVNSLQINGRVIVPVYGQPTDAKALQIYTQLGLKAVGVDSDSLSNDGQGSVHCITMAYPKVSMTTLVDALGGQAL